MNKPKYERAIVIKRKFRIYHKKISKCILEHVELFLIGSQNTE